MHSSSNQPSPFVTQTQLNAHMNKQVVVAGKVLNVTQASLLLDGENSTTITVHRNQPPTMMIEPGTKLLVRGLVKPDLSIAESPTFPATDVGDNFDISLFNEAAAVTSQVNYAHLFTK